ncbi:MAG: Rad52/Rad22 family DNA repair protein [Gemmatimonadaceae bacterium]
MIARHETQTEPMDVWRRLSAPVDPQAIAWRQDGRPITRDGKYFARFVAYIEANTVRERLDAVVPGEWNLTLELLPSVSAADDLIDAAPFAFKARLQILGVVREDVGTGKDYKQASTDAFKRAAVRFGIGNELYSFEQNWVPMDGDGKFAKPLEDPRAVYERRQSRPADRAPSNDDAAPSTLPFTRGLIASDVPPCPKCGRRMWDNRIGKRNPKAPDFKCRDRGCDGVIWPPRSSTPAQAAEGTGEEVAQVAAPATTEQIPF